MDKALRAVHLLLWKDWLAGSLERQQADLLVQASEAHQSIEEFVKHWQTSRPYLTFIPDSAQPAERTLFIGNLEVLLSRIHNQYFEDPPSAAVPKASCPAVQLVLTRIRIAYTDPDLSLHTLASVTGISKRSLSRKWKECMGKSFGEYLADLRMEKAVALLRDSSFDIKAISLMVGYRDCNYFIRDFRWRMNCTPGQFRLTASLPEKSPSHSDREPRNNGINDLARLYYKLAR